VRIDGSARRAGPARFFLLAAAALAALVAVGSSAAVRDPSRRAAPPQVRELIVRFAVGVGAQERAAVARKHGTAVERDLRVANLAVVRVPAAQTAGEAAAALEREPHVLYAEPNYIRKLAATPNDARWGELWGLRTIAAPAAWDTTTGSDAVAVAVVDTGVAHTHPDLADNIWRNAAEVAANRVDDDGNGYVDDVRGWDFVAVDADPSDESGHGTHVAGTIGAHGNNGVGVTGVNWRVKLMALRAGSDAGLADSDIIAAFRYACAKGAKIINGSFGGPGGSAALRDAITACPAALFVFAAGNDGHDNDAAPSYPCAYPAANIVCVAATGRDDALASWSSYGASSVDLAAPGVSILSTSLVHTVYRESFDGPTALPPGWETGGTGVWSRTSEASVSAPYSMTESPGGLHADNAKTWLRRTAPLDLSGYSDCSLEYRIRSDFDWYDGVWIMTSTDTIWTDDDIWARWSGGTGGAFDWDRAPLDLTRTVYFGFELRTDGVDPPGDGAHIDDVAVSCYGGNAVPTEYESWDGTSMATPHVAGAAGLVLAHNPAFSVAQLRQAILGGVDSVPALAAKVASGGRLNVAKALGLTAPPPQRAPVAENQSIATNEDVTRPVTLAATDADGDPLTYSVVSGPTHGVLTGTPPNLSYTPAPNYNGPDALTFRARDAARDSNLATVSITITPVNDAPSALGQGLTTDEDAAKTVVLSATDVDGDTLTYAVVGGPTNGVLSGTAPNLEYTPSANYNGLDSFTFRASDGAAESEATVTLAVAAVNDAPVAEGQTLTTPYGTPVAIRLTGTDVEAGELIFEVVDGPAHGALSGTSPDLTYTPADGYSGTDELSFRARDGSDRKSVV
jgi:subtilisin family serine protease